MTTEQDSREVVILNNLSAIYHRIEALCTDSNGRPPALSMREGQTKLRPGIRRKRDAKAGEQL